VLLRSKNRESGGEIQKDNIVSMTAVRADEETKE
jgi:hypothetical protein